MKFLGKDLTRLFREEVSDHCHRGFQRGADDVMGCVRFGEGR